MIVFIVQIKFKKYTVKYFTDYLFYFIEHENLI